MGSLDYFEKVKLKGNKAENLQERYQEATKGLDQEVAFEALEGGRVFDTSDRKRYDELMANRGKAKEKAQVQQQESAVSSDKEVSPAVETNQNQNANEGLNQSQEVRQDNDINTNINGDNNTVKNTQDNSVRQYGGNTKVFNYQGGGDLNDSPVSAGTMAGYFYDEDSPAKSAAFVDRYTTQNRDYQKQFQDRGHAQDAIDKADRNQTINIDNLDQRIKARTQANRARSTAMAGDIFGDMFNFSPDEFKGPEAQDPIKTPNFKKLGKI